MELTFCELRAKEVVNICDGKRLGNIVDMTFDSCTALITGIVVPSEKTLFSFLKSNSDIFIPYCCIRKIGKDVILVEITPTTTLSNNPNKTCSINSTQNVDQSKENVQTNN